MKKRIGWVLQKKESGIVGSIEDARSTKTAAWFAHPVMDSRDWRMLPVYVEVPDGK